MQREVDYAQGKEARTFDLIFLDLGMPIMDGYEACELIIQHYQILAKSA